MVRIWLLIARIQNIWRVIIRCVFYNKTKLLKVKNIISFSTENVININKNLDYNRLQNIRGDSKVQGLPTKRI